MLRIAGFASTLPLQGRVSKHTLAFSRRDASELWRKLHTLRKQEGAGKAGCALHPRSRVQICTKENAHEHTGEAEASGFPCAVVSTGL